MFKLITIFKWNYTPANYFEQEIEYKINGWEIQINSGHAQAIIQTTEPVSKNQDLRQEIHKEIERPFLAQQLLKHKAHSLSYDHLEEENNEGKRSIIVEVETVTLKLSVLPAEFTITDKNGNVTYDSTSPRTAREEIF